MNNLTCSKIWGEYPFAHRQPTHDGHCRWVHGHGWKFEVEFSCTQRDTNGFVVDFGKLKFIRNMFDEMFDHTLVLSKNDPERNFFEEMQKKDLAKITWVDDVSAEGLALFLVDVVNEAVNEATNGRVQASRVRVYEQPDDWADAFLIIDRCGCCK